jgi:uncharacterized damage-inducible protein DinB
MTTATASIDGPAVALFDTNALRETWQGHRRLTRRVIEAFPDEALFSYRLGGMRSFGEMAVELLRMAAPSVRGVASGTWDSFENADATSKAELLSQWDASTVEMDRLLPSIPVERFGETMKAFGQWEGRVIDLLLYCIDNEIHHRGQGYVYLRSLGVEPPPFWERQ